MSSSSPSVFVWLEVANWTLVVPVLFLVNSYFGYKVYGTLVEVREQIEPRKKAKKAKALWNGLAIFTSSLFYSLSALCFALYYWLPPSSCQSLVRFGTCGWQLAKLTMYTVFILRVDSVYAHTSHSYGKCTINALLAFCWIFGGLLVASTLITPKGDSEKSDTAITFCHAHFPLWSLAASLFLDTSVSCCTLWMFTKPLNRITTSLQQSDDCISQSVQTKIRSIHALAIRYTVVTWTAVISTVIVMFCYAVTNSVFIGPFDYAVNCACLGLLTNWYSERFEQLCALPLWLSRCCFKCDVDTGIERKRMPNLSTLSVASDLTIEVEMAVTSDSSG